MNKLLKSIIKSLLLVSLVVYLVYGDAKLDGEKFLAENAKKPGVITLPSGLQYKVLKSGDGNYHPTEDSTCSCHYHGTLINGDVFDSSVNRGQPTDFAPNQVIKGWTEAMQLMVEGDKFELYIPSDLAYGARGSPPKIPGGATLIFTIEMLKIKGDKKPAQRCDVGAPDKCNETEQSYIQKMKNLTDVDLAKEIERLKGLLQGKMKPELHDWANKRMSLLDQLKSKFMFKAQDATDQAKDTASEQVKAAQDAAEQVKEYVAEQARRASEAASQAKDSASEQGRKAQDATTQAKEGASEQMRKAQSTKEQIKESASEQLKKAHDAANQAKEYVSEQLKKGQDAAKQTKESTSEQVRNAEDAATLEKKGTSDQARKAEGIKEKVKESASEQLKNVQDAANQAQEYVSEQLKKVQDATTQAKENTSEQIRKTQDTKEQLKETVSEEVRKAQEAAMKGKDSGSAKVREDL